METIEFLYKLLGPMAIPFLAGVGLFSLPSIRKRLVNMIPFGGKKSDDSLAERLLAQNENQMTQFLEVYKENTAALHGALNAIRALAGEVEVVTKDSRAGRVFNEEAFSRVHQRLDSLVEAHAHRGMK